MPYRITNAKHLSEGKKEIRLKSVKKAWTDVSDKFGLSEGLRKAGLLHATSHCFGGFVPRGLQLHVHAELFCEREILIHKRQHLFDRLRAQC